ncbi:MAG TPA: TetR/AcrR family transcriptional regulator [Nannocystis exedens]|nr:TetR/AcrR family transcriptional regulator [Nannocystis exedens]
MSRNNRAGLRQAIVEASLKLGAELGEDGLTMRGIASRLGVSATALYQHFDSKAAILREIRLYGSDLLSHEITEKCSSIESPLDRVRAMAVSYIAFARKQPWLYSVLMRSERLDWTTMNPEEIERTLRPLTRLRSWLREGVDKGVWRPGIDPEVASFRLWAGLHGLCDLMLSGRIDENHPAFPIKSQVQFVEDFIQGVIGTLVATPVAAPELSSVPSPEPAN